MGNGNAQVVMNSPDESVFGVPRRVRRLPESGPGAGGLPRRGGSPLRSGPAGAGVRAACGARAPRVSLELLGAADSSELRALAAEVAPGNVHVAAQPDAVRGNPEPARGVRPRRGPHRARSVHRAAAAGQAARVRAHGAAGGGRPPAGPRALLRRGRAALLQPRLGGVAGGRDRGGARGSGGLRAARRNARRSGWRRSLGPSSGAATWRWWTSSRPPPGRRRAAARRRAPR